MKNFRLTAILSCVRRYSQTAKTPSSSGIKTSPGSASPEMNIDVTGLSSRCVKSSSEPVGPGASSSGQYKVPEYFLYSKATYHEAEIELAKYRCPQPSALKK